MSSNDFSNSNQTDTQKTPITSYITVEKAKAYFDEQIEVLKREKGVQVREITNTDATFDGLDVRPQWDKAKVVDNSAISFVEVPFIFTDSTQLSSSTGQNNQVNPIKKSASRLIISQNSQGNRAISFMSVSADNDFLSNNQGTLENFTYSRVPNMFKGVEMHYNIRGKFNNGWHFNQGRIDGIIKKNDARNNAVQPRTCRIETVCYEIERYSVRVGNYQVTTIVQDCSYNLVIGFCNGWYDFDYFPNGNNGGYGGFRNQTITLDYDKLSSSTDLFIASVIIHESIHAYLSMYFTAIHPDWWIQSTQNQSVHPDACEFEVLLQAYIDHQTGNEAQHQQMKATYLAYIRDALVSFSGSSDNEMINICGDLAWAGLNRTNLPLDVQTRISNRINAEAKNRPVNGVSPKGRKGCD